MFTTSTGKYVPLSGSFGCVASFLSCPGFKAGLGAIHILRHAGGGGGG